MKLADACGVFGLVLTKKGREEKLDPGRLVYLGLERLQHRGTESSGIVGSTGHSDQFHITKGLGLVRDVFTLPDLQGFHDSRVLLGHNRYSTAGLKDAINAVQPFVVHTTRGVIAIAHNGELVNKAQLRQEVLSRGVGLSTDTDSELIAQILSSLLADAPTNGHSNGHSHPHPQPQQWSKLGDAMLSLIESGRLSLSYSLLLMNQNRLFAVRDPHGNRPLALAEIRDTHGDLLALVAASESCAFGALSSPGRYECRLTREVERGEVVELRQDGASISRIAAVTAKTRASLCLFEYVYFARPSSVIQGVEVQAVRTASGRMLAREAPVAGADLVSTVPDSSLPAALGFAQEAGLPFGYALDKNGYVGRTFIQPSEKLRQGAVLRKFNVAAETVSGKSLVLVDDSIVRGNTMRPIVRLLKEAGAREVHIRLASPPIKSPCYYGINIPARQELIAARLSLDQIRDHIGADSVAYLSLDGLKAAVQEASGSNSGHHSASLCTGCLNQHYPSRVPDIEECL